MPDGSFANASGSVTARWTFDVVVDTSAATRGSVVVSLVGNVMSLLRLDVPGALFTASTDDEAFSISEVMPAGRHR